MNPKVFSISELTDQIRSTLEDSIGSIWIEGEISNLTYHPSGHVYLTLKDADSQISAVMFRNDAARLRFRLKDGMQVQGFGRITVYARRGNYQIVLETVQLAGMGNLQAAFEALKKKLQDEGLFSEERKRPLPAFPQAVGVVTSSQGAALRDFCRVLHRRFPGVRIILAPARVQGAGAGQEVAAAIDLLNITEASGVEASIDAIAIIRGGGSLEDLWAFNEEIVARAIARSKIPTIAGIGHEVDFTIADFVADVRAPTPSAAAELLIRPRSEFAAEVLSHSRMLDRCSRLALGQLRHRLVEAREVLRTKEPRHLLRERRIRLDEVSSLLFNRCYSHIADLRTNWLDMCQRFQHVSPKLVVEKKRVLLNEQQQRMQQNFSTRVTQLRHRLEIQDQRIRLLSPDSTLSRGYSITMDSKTGKILRSSKKAEKGQALTTRLRDGEIQSRVE
jgi:exodeoxyribonuclease VII large subunit